MQHHWKSKVHTAALMAVVLSGLTTYGAAAHAASNDSWNKLRQDTRKACLAASEFKDPKVLEGPIMFNSAVWYRIGGIWPQKHMEGQSGKVHCLHPYPNGEPEITE